MIHFGQLPHAFVICILFAYPLIYIGNYAGDSQVHLIFGEHAAQGRFFEFNLGEKSAGVTSPGYMLLIAGFFKVAPDTWVPALIKMANLLFWYGLIALVFAAAKTLTGSERWAALGALAAGLLPGSAYNATNGMENGIFAFLIAAWILMAMRFDWFGPKLLTKEVFRTELFLGAVLGLTCWFRPEGFAFAAIALTFRAALSIRRSSDLRKTIAIWALLLIPFLVIAGGVVYFHWDQTGHFIPTSGSSRVLMSNLATDTIHVGAMHFTPRMGIRLLAYFPLTLMSFLAIWMLFRERNESSIPKEIIGFLFVMFWSFFILYSFVFGAVHISRYLIFAMPALVLMAIIGAKYAWEFWEGASSRRFNNVYKLTAVVLVATLAGVYSVETGLRLNLDSQSSLWRSMQAPVERQAFSDELYKLIGEPENLPVSIALQEVQARYWLDSRFVVRSLDGRIDAKLLDYANRTSIDHIGYLNDRQVQYLLDTPSYNRDSDVWSLMDLDELKPGEETWKNGVTFTRLFVDRSLLELAIDQETSEPRWFVGESGLVRLHWFMSDCWWNCKSYSTLIRLEH